MEERDLHEIIPPSLNNLRACLLCKLIKTAEQWEGNGCENCLDKVAIYDQMEDFTTPKFVGYLNEFYQRSLLHQQCFFEVSDDDGSFKKLGS